MTINPQDVWNAPYEGIPADTEVASLGANRIRDLKVNIRQRMAVCMVWDDGNTTNSNDGKLNNGILFAQGGDPTLDAGDGAIYQKAVSGNAELFYKDSSGHVTQLTTGGAVNFIIPPGVIFHSGLTSAPAGYLLCDGGSHATASFPGLFGAIGYTYGGAGANFNTPDTRGRSALADDAATNRLSGSSMSGSTPNSTGGEPAHVLTVAELAAHNHVININDPQHNHHIGPPVITNNSGGSSPTGAIGSGGTQSTFTDNNITGITATSNNNGSSVAHNNVQPSIVLGYDIIKT